MIGRTHKLRTLTYCGLCGVFVVEALHPHDWPGPDHLPEPAAVVLHYEPPAIGSAVGSNTIHPPTLDLRLRLP
jgi:hypothetical protein